MTSMVVPGLMIGAGGGALLGFLKYRSPLVGAILGACAGAAVGHFVFSGPATVRAVETPTAFESEVLSAEEPVLVDFYAPTCGPCRQLAPTIESLAEEYAGRVRFVKVDVRKVGRVAHQYGIRAIPTVMVFLHGRPVLTFVGVRPVSEYRSALQSALSAT